MTTSRTITAKASVVSLLLVIKDVLTNSGSNRVKEEQHAMRMQMIYDKFILSQSIDINGDVVAGGEDYLGGATETYDRRRIDVANAVFNIIMADHIEKKLPTNLLSSRGGYALGIRRLSCTDMTQTCNKCTAEFLFGTSKADEQTEAAFRHIYGSDDKMLKGLKTAILKKKLNKNDTSFRGEKKIVIFTPAQMKSFEALGEFAAEDRG